MQKLYAIHYTLPAGRQALYAKKGLTLIEIIISAVIMATTIAGIFTVFTSGNKFVQRSNRRLIAINLAQEQLENRRVQISADTWGNPNDGSNLGLTAAGWTNWTNVIALPIPFDYRYRVDSDEHNTIPSNVPLAEVCRRVYMQVRWTLP